MRKVKAHRKANEAEHCDGEMFGSPYFADRLVARAAQTASVCDWRREAFDEAISKTLAVQGRLIACHLLFLEARGANDEKARASREAGAT